MARAAMSRVSASGTSASAYCQDAWMWWSLPMRKQLRIGTPFMPLRVWVTANEDVASPFQSERSGIVFRYRLSL